MLDHSSFWATDGDTQRYLHVLQNFLQSPMAQNKVVSDPTHIHVDHDDDGMTHPIATNWNTLP